MEPMNGEQFDFGEEEYGGGQKMQYNQGGAIPALADEEMIGEEDDEYDDLYNDVNVGESFMQVQRPDSQIPPFKAENRVNPSGTGDESIPSEEANASKYAGNRAFGPGALQFPEQKAGLNTTEETSVTVDRSQTVRNSQTDQSGYQGSVAPNNKTEDQVKNMDKTVGDPSSINPNVGVGSKGAVPFNFMNMAANANAIRPVDDEYSNLGSSENGNTMLYVGELHWWTTDAEIESVLIQYGKVKEIKFFDERASGKSKGYCQVEFFDPAAAHACKEGMNGYVFNGRACVVAFATPQTIKQMGASYMNRNQGQPQAQFPGRNAAMNDGGAGRGVGTNFSGGDAGRNFGRGAWGGRGGNQSLNSRVPGSGNVRGRGNMGNKPPNSGGAGGGGNYGPGFGGPPGGMMHPQGMMGPGFDLAFMGRGAGYGGGFTGPAFPGMLPPFPAVNTLGLPGVAPHVNPAFFGRGMAPNGMGMMGPSGMGGPYSGLWNDASVGGGWGGEEQGRGPESSYGG
ncbi:hypothetical protein M569_13847, partial [Genlisea aurea]